MPTSDTPESSLATQMALIGQEVKLGFKNTEQAFTTMDKNIEAVKSKIDDKLNPVVTRIDDLKSARDHEIAHMKTNQAQVNAMLKAELDKKVDKEDLTPWTNGLRWLLYIVVGAVVITLLGLIGLHKL